MFKKILNNLFLKSAYKAIEKTAAIKEENNQQHEFSIDDEIKNLWSIINDSSSTESQRINAITDVFVRTQMHISPEEFSKRRLWIRFVYIAVHAGSTPIDALIEYVDKSNYIPLTKCLSNLSISINKENDETLNANIDSFAKAVYLHILKNIREDDVPSLLLLGQIAQRKGDFDEARKWFETIIEKTNSFCGITLTLKNYKKEVLNLISKRSGNEFADREINERIDELNKCQRNIYESCYNSMREKISEKQTDEFKAEYITILTNYSAFELSTGNYDRALELLSDAPKGYPNGFRIPLQRAMIYQYKPAENPHFNLHKAEECFEKAEKEYMSVCGDQVDKKAIKSILVPLANTLMRQSKYKKACEICNKVLAIDPMEENAIRLKKRIALYI